ncbi:MAG: tRNA 2-thiouridine(34) synthase MnmA [Spirochaetes bacterium]|nr:tRNA 2-thiouridine(34) synthase MnmA [Spirochaetota bacterium]MBL7006400.1 tRNA 2-thiouridine(34) synthase MnmA [Spirochaetia bacterium]
MSKKVVVGLSGGVDSSVAAALLVDQGYQVIGVTMNIWDGTVMSEFEGRHACFGPDEEEDAAKAAEVCEILGIPFHQFDVRKEYRDIVLADFSHEYSQGRTPNPCVRCNSRIKFGALVEKVEASGIAFDYFATGHYVRRQFHPKWQTDVLLMSADRKKDQSYFLYRLTQAQVKKTLFPLGEMLKDTVREIAESKKLGFEEVRESQDFICGDYTELLDFDFIPGEIVDTEGEVLGEHTGFAKYTIGQRRGLGIAASRPFYVVGIDREKNQVIVGHKEQVFGHSLQADQMNWLISPELLGVPSFEAQAKIRSQQKPFAVQVTPNDDLSCTIDFIEPQWAIAPGQSVVLYDNDLVIGGGIIDI